MNKASTGPQSCDCGKGRGPDDTRHPRRGFNGAAVLRLRKDPAPRAARLRHVEASTGPQSCDCGKSPPPTAHASRRIVLQRGRSLATAESSPAAVDKVVLRLLQRGRSLATAESIRRRTRRARWSCFNGAAVLRLRKGSCARSAWPRRRASTGPQSCDCGKGSARRGRERSARASTGPQSCDCGKLWTALIPGGKPMPLQRGRSLATAESSPSLRSAKPASASTGPQSCDCGKLPDRVHARRGGIASTGPQSCDCGKARRSPRARASACRFNGAAVLRLRKGRAS